MSPRIAANHQHPAGEKKLELSHPKDTSNTDTGLKKGGMDITQQKVDLKTKESAVKEYKKLVKIYTDLTKKYQDLMGLIEMHNN